MDNISYIRAGISCLPVIGPFMSLFNDREINNEKDRYSSRLEENTRAQTENRSSLGSLLTGFGQATGARTAILNKDITLSERQKFLLRRGNEELHAQLENSERPDRQRLEAFEATEEEEQQIKQERQQLREELSVLEQDFEGIPHRYLDISADIVELELKCLGIVQKGIATSEKEMFYHRCSVVGAVLTVAVVAAAVAFISLTTLTIFGTSFAVALASLSGMSFVVLIGGGVAGYVGVSSSVGLSIALLWGALSGERDRRICQQRDDCRLLRQSLEESIIDLERFGYEIQEQRDLMRV